LQREVFRNTPTDDAIREILFDPHTSDGQASAGIESEFSVSKVDFSIPTIQDIRHSKRFFKELFKGYY
jgi:hypothetical protein